MIAFTGQRYKIWKQITTLLRVVVRLFSLLLLVKDTKFESKSQHLSLDPRSKSYCFYWSKIQNLKANHNDISPGVPHHYIAFTGQRYKIWKQITTTSDGEVERIGLLLLVKDTKFESKSQRINFSSFMARDCFYWSKIQNLKANHNVLSTAAAAFAIAFTGQRYKIWKQITTWWLRLDINERLLLLVKDTKFESKSQRYWS